MFEVEPGVFAFKATFPDSIAARFEEFHKRNPHVYDGLVRLAHDAKEKGHAMLGIEFLFAVLRWQTMMQTDDPSSDYKLNDHYTSRYARLIMAREEDLAGFFETRELRSE